MDCAIEEESQEGEGETGCGMLVIVIERRLLEKGL